MSSKKERQKILVIDDEPDLVKILKLKLEQEGYKCFSALAGPEGLKSAKENKPDLILLDILMPELDGFQVLEKLKKMPEVKKSKIVMLSVSGREEDLKKSFAMGAVGYLIKTKFSLEEIIKKIKRCLEDNCCSDEICECQVWR